MIDIETILSFDRESLRSAELGSGDLQSLIERLRRVIQADPEHRLINQCGGNRGSGQLLVYRACPPDKCIRAGDWVSLSESYAEDHVRGDSTEVVSMMVDIDDVLWAGTDNNEWFFAPSVYARPDASSLYEALHEMSLEDAEALVRMACGEVSDYRPEAAQRSSVPARNSRIGPMSATDTKSIITRMIPRLKETFALDWNDGIHGISHWSRVFLNGRLLAASMDVNPEIVAWFSFLHDIKRENDGTDADHGARAAEFAHVLRHEGVIRLSRPDFDRLCFAMEGHSDGHVGGDRAVQVCWDADRLDLGRVGMVPSAQYLSTELARDPEFLAQAYARSIGRKWAPEDSSSDDDEDEYDWRVELERGRE